MNAYDTGNVSGNCVLLTVTFVPPLLMVNAFLTGMIGITILGEMVPSLDQDRSSFTSTYRGG